MPTPMSFMKTSPEIANAPITTASSKAALVMIRPVSWTPDVMRNSFAAGGLATAESNC